MPTISIVIPTHNRPRRLLSAVNSALSECPIEGEVIVVDDGSATPAQEVLSEIVDDRLRVIRIDKAQGAANARNIGVKSAINEVAFFLDDDDVFRRGYIDRVVRLLAQSPSAGYGYSGRGYAVDETKQRSTSLKHNISPASFGFWVKRELFLDVGGFDPKQTVDEDTDLCVRLKIAGARMLTLNEAGTKIRPEDSASSQFEPQLTTATPASIVIDCYRRTYEKSSMYFQPLSRSRWFLATRFIRRCVKLGESTAAWHFSRAQRPFVFSMMLMAFWATKMGLRR